MNFFSLKKYFCKELPYLKSLFYKYRNVEALTKKEIDEKNFRLTAEGYLSSKPLKLLNNNEKQKINLLADKKLEELENSGLSKEEILNNNTEKGIPLSVDPFFQYIKKNHFSREILLSPNEEFTIDKIIKLALNQNIGPDNSSSKIGKVLIDESKLSTSSKHLLKNNINNKIASLQKSDFFSHEKILEDIDIENSKTKLMPKPITPRTKRKLIRLRLNDLDIHWRNLELITKFLNRFGLIKTRYQTGLSKIQQKKITKQIKIARCMFLLPTFGYLKPFHKESLTSIEDDIIKTYSKKIDLETGALYNEKNSKFLNNDKNILTFGDIWNNSKNSLKKLKVYLKKRKYKELEKRGIDVDKWVKNINQFNVDYLYNIKEIKDDEENNFKELENDYIKLKENLSNVSIYDFLDLVLSEQKENFEKINYLNSLESIKNEETKYIENELKYDNLLEELGNIKKEILENVDNDLYDEDYLNNKIELKTVKRISLSQL